MDTQDVGLAECCRLALEWAPYAPLEVVLRMNVVGFWGADHHEDGTSTVYFSSDAEFGTDVVVPTELVRRTCAYIREHESRLLNALAETDSITAFRHVDGRPVSLSDFVALGLIPRKS